MTVYAWPPYFKASMFEAQLVPNVRRFDSPYGGASQALDLLGERWRFAIEMQPCGYDEAAEREAFLHRLMGPANRVSLSHFGRPVPRGTARGTMLTSGTTAQGTSSVAITGGTASGTLLAGDVLGIGGQLMMVAANVTLSGAGAGTVTFVNRMRAQVASSSAVNWNGPTADFSLQSSSGVPVAYKNGIVSGTSLEFLETWG